MTNIDLRHKLELVEKSAKEELRRDLTKDGYVDEDDCSSYNERMSQLMLVIGTINMICDMDEKLNEILEKLG